jgi:hypothetical protein
MSFTLTTSGAILRKAGANSNTTINASGGAIKEFSDQAEAFIIAATKKDWVSQYANISTNAKPLLDQMTSDLAAMYMIMYDMAGYTSRTESQTMLDVLRDNFERSLKILQDTEVQDFIL